MAGVLRSYDDWAAALNGQKSFSDQGAPENPLQPGGTSQASSAAPAAPAAPEPTIPKDTGPAVSSDLYPAPSSSISDTFKPALNPFTKTISQASAKLETAGKGFYDSAGPSRTFEGIGGKQTLEAALAPDTTANQDNTATMGAAKSLVGAQYQGPQGLDQSIVADLQAAADELKASSGTLNQGAGVEGLLQVQHPGAGASQDELAWDAGRMMAQRDWQQSVRGLQSDIGRFQAQIGQGQSAAETFAAQRAAEEDSIRQLAREYLQGRQADVTTGIDQRLAQEQAGEQALGQAYDQFQKTGDLSALQGLPADQGIDLGAFNTQGTQLRAKADAARAAVDAQFSDLRNVPLMSAQVDSHGNPVLGWSKEQYAELKQHYTAKDLKALKARAQERQAALEQAGFSPGLQLQQGGAAKGQLKTTLEGGAVKRVTKTGKKDQIAGGEFSTIDPLYLGGDLGSYQPADLRSYIGRQEGDLATRENVSTAEERMVYNRSAELLNQADRIEQAATPHEKSKLTSQAARYIDEEVKALESRKEDLTAGMKAYIKKAKDARDHFLRANRIEEWGNIGAVVGGILGSGAPPVLGTALGAVGGALVGREAGRQLA